MKDKGPYYLPYYDALDKLALEALEETGLEIDEPDAIKFARLLLLKVQRYPMPKMHDVLKSLGERKDRRKRRP